MDKSYIIEMIEGYTYAMKRDLKDLDMVKFNQHLTEIGFFVNEEINDTKKGFRNEI